ncbi:MAG: peptidoglycan DD-metalloendopeptidase family protein [Thermodesulfovibrionia bacterium]
MNRVLFLVVMVFIMNNLSFIPHPSASTPEEELSEVKKRLEEERRKVKESIKEERSILSELERIERAIKEKGDELNKHKKETTRIEASIRILEADIERLNNDIERTRGHLKEKLRLLYRQRLRGELPLILISAKDYHDLLKRSRFLSLIAHHDSKLMEGFGNEIKMVEIKKRQLETLREELYENERSIDKKLKELQRERDEKKTLLASIKSKRSNYEKMVRELEESSRRLNEMIMKMDKGDSSFVTRGRSFASLKGQLSWPVNGEIIIPFGKYKDPQFNIPVFKNGIEIRSDMGEYVKAVYDGKVVYADWFKGYGQVIIISHGDNYHSLYGNLSEIFYKIGDIIKKGDAIGRVGQSGVSNEPTLYFEIRYKGKPIDPERWLKKKGA